MGIFRLAAGAYAVMYTDDAAAGRTGPFFRFHAEECVHAVFTDEVKVENRRFNHGIGAGVADFLFQNVGAGILFAGIAEAAGKFLPNGTVYDGAAHAAALGLEFARTAASGTGRIIAEMAAAERAVQAAGSDHICFHRDGLLCVDLK